MNRLEEYASAAADRMRRLRRAVGDPPSRTRGIKPDPDEIRRADEILRNLRLIVDSIPAPVAIMTPSGQVEAVNRLTLEYFGKGLDELKSWSTADAVHPDDLPRTVATWTKAVEAGEKYEIESRHRRADGVYRWFRVNGFPLRDNDGRIVRWCVLQTDIEDRKQAEEKLRRSETFLAEAQQLTRIGSFSWRMPGDKIIWSEQLYRIFEFDQADTVTLGRIASRVHPEDLARFDEMIGRMRNAGADFEYEHRLLMPDQSVKHLHLMAHATRDGDGQVEYIGAAQDVTQRRSSEEALAKIRSELAHVSRITSLGVLAASIAHEVKQPIASILMNGETSLRRLARPQPDLENVRQLTARMVADARRAAEIIDRTRSMASRRAPQTASLSLGEIVEQSIALLRHEFQARGISVSVDLTPSLPLVVGDRTQLQQVIVNLVINAAQAVAQHDTIRRSIFIRTMQPAPETVGCSVEDSGPGIDPALLPRLFDSFFTTKDTGMGMGLPICRSIIEAHEGRILADNDSALGGARFSFALPASFAGA